MVVAPWSTISWAVMTWTDCGTFSMGMPDLPPKPSENFEPVTMTESDERVWAPAGTAQTSAMTDVVAQRRARTDMNTPK
jgi:hypothetical protein